MELRLKELIEEAFQKCKKDILKHTTSNIPAAMPQRLNFDQLDKSAPRYCDFLEEKKNIDQIPSLNNIQKPLRILYKCFDYIEMSPQKSVVHQKTYVINKAKRIKNNLEGYLKNTKIISLNESEGFLEQIFKFWITKANKLAEYDKLDLAEQITANELSIFYLLGEPGIGKTALLNYIFSINANKLRDKNIIWIRVDLNNPWGLNLRLQHRLLNKFLKIFSKYYLFNRRYNFDNNFLIKLKHYLINKNKLFFNSEAETACIVDEFIRFLKRIHKESTKGKNININLEIKQSALSTENILDLIEQTISYLQSEYNYGFIFIFDGLDSVTLDRIQYKLYCDWIEQIMTLLNNRNNNIYKAVYIISMRDYSFIHYWLKLFKTRKFPRGDYVIMRVNQVPFYDILSKRFDYALDMCKNHSCNIKKVAFWNIKNNLIDIVCMSLYGLTAEEFAQQFVSNKNRKREEYDITLELCNANYRAMMRFFRELLLVVSGLLGERTFEILSSKTGYECLQHFDGKQWAVHRVLLFGDIGATAYRNRISYDINGDPIVKTDRDL